MRNFSLLIFVFLSFAFLPLLSRGRKAGLIPTITPLADWSKVKYFNSFEFDSKDLSGSGKNMMASTLQRLDKMRELLGVPITINSGYRTKAHNKRVGGSPNSSHLFGYAADIHCYSQFDLEHKVKIAYKAGFRRIGQYKTKNGNYFIHLDNDPLKYGAYWCEINGKPAPLFVNPEH